MNKICVYCASSTQIKKHFYDAADKLGEIIASKNMTLLYGGGHRGLMGKIADSALAANGKVIGIIPEFMCELEWNHTGLTELILVGSMHERKEMLLRMADAVVALPGGVGTFEELLEAITWKKLGLYTNPIVIVNTNGYYDPLIEMLVRSVDENFMGQDHRKMWSVVLNPEDVFDAIKNSGHWDENARDFAAI